MTYLANTHSSDSSICLQLILETVILFHPHAAQKSGDTHENQYHSIPHTSLLSFHRETITLHFSLAKGILTTSQTVSLQRNSYHLQTSLKSSHSSRAVGYFALVISFHPTSISYSVGTITGSDIEGWPRLSVCLSLCRGVPLFYVILQSVPDYWCGCTTEKGSVFPVSLSTWLNLQTNQYIQ